MPEAQAPKNEQKPGQPAAAPAAGQTPAQTPASALNNQVKAADGYAAQRAIVSPDGGAKAQPGDVVKGWVVYENEARKGGSLAWRNNNPGNIRAGSFADAHGAYAGKASGGFAVFASQQQGFDAIVALLKTATYSNKTIAKAISTYAPSADSNDPVAYAANIEKWTGMKADTVMSTLTDEQLGQVATAIKREEGSIEGTTVPRSDPSLPSNVLQ